MLSCYEGKRKMTKQQVWYLQFPWKLHMILKNAETRNQTDIISWTPNGTSFTIHDKKRFEKEIMPEYFNTTVYKSFQRNMNMWGFRNVARGMDLGVFANEYFIRGEPDLCRCMSRVSNSPNTNNNNNNNNDTSYNNDSKNQDQNQSQSDLSLKDTKQGNLKQGSSTPHPASVTSSTSFYEAATQNLHRPPPGTHCPSPVQLLVHPSSNMIMNNVSSNTWMNMLDLINATTGVSPPPPPPPPPPPSPPPAMVEPVACSSNNNSSSNNNNNMFLISSELLQVAQEILQKGQNESSINYLINRGLSPPPPSHSLHDQAIREVEPIASSSSSSTTTSSAHMIRMMMMSMMTMNHPSTSPSAATTTATTTTTTSSLLPCQSSGGRFFLGGGTVNPIPDKTYAHHDGSVGENEELPVVQPLPQVQLLHQVPQASAQQDDDSSNKPQLLRRVPCKARNMPVGHNSVSACFMIPQSIKHGELLICSYPQCQQEGVKFIFCNYCQCPVAKRTFRARHHHHYPNSNSNATIKHQHQVMSIMNTKTKHSKEKKKYNNQKDHDTTTADAVKSTKKVVTLPVSTLEQPKAQRASMILANIKKRVRNDDDDSGERTDKVSLSSHLNTITTSVEDNSNNEGNTMDHYGNTKTKTNDSILPLKKRKRKPIMDITPKDSSASSPTTNLSTALGVSHDQWMANHHHHHQHHPSRTPYSNNGTTTTATTTTTTNTATTAKTEKDPRIAWARQLGLQGLIPP